MSAFLKGFLSSAEITVDYSRGVPRVLIDGSTVRAREGLLARLWRLEVRAVTALAFILHAVFVPHALISHFRRGAFRWQRVENIGARIYVIPLFYNLALDYELHGDYSRYIKSVEIRRNNNRRGEWRVAFLFSEVPERGYMRVRYI